MIILEYTLENSQVANIQHLLKKDRKNEERINSIIGEQSRAGKLPEGISQDWIPPECLESHHWPSRHHWLIVYGRTRLINIEEGFLSSDKCYSKHGPNILYILIFRKHLIFSFASEIAGFGIETLGKVQSHLLGRELYLSAFSWWKCKERGCKNSSPLFGINTNDSVKEGHCELCTIS